MSRLWAITSYFNPMRYRRRLQNYLAFRRRLTVPLVAVELAYHPEFDLPPDAADVVLRLRGDDVLWQKERLLNLAIAHLPPECDTVAWLDCDIVFQRDDWAELALRGLERHPLLQPFRRVYEPGPDAWDVDAPVPPDAPLGSAQAELLDRGMALPVLLSGDMRARHGSQMGLAWVARRELVESAGFYDVCVLGSGDRALLCAALGATANMVDYLRMGPAWARHYEAWAARLFGRVRGNIGCTDGTVVHLWHGDLRHRRHRCRHEPFAAFGFDPAVDIALADAGCWRWNTDKPQMHAHVAEFFRSRREDGEPSSPALAASQA